MFGVEDCPCECVGFGSELDVGEGVDGGPHGSERVLLLDWHAVICVGLFVLLLLLIEMLLLVAVGMRSPLIAHFVNERLIWWTSIQYEGGGLFVVVVEWL